MLQTGVNPLQQRPTLSSPVSLKKPPMGGAGGGMGQAPGQTTASPSYGQTPYNPGGKFLFQSAGDPLGANAPKPPPDPNGPRTNTPAPAGGNNAGGGNGGQGGGGNGNEPNPFIYYSQPYAGQSYPDMASQAPNLAPVGVASARTNIPIEAAPTISSIMEKFSQNGMPNLNEGGQTFSLPLGNTSLSPYAQNAFDTKAGFTMNDFGIPENVREQMKVQKAQQINSGYDLQREAAKRLLAKSGLLQDSAALQQERDLSQANQAERDKAYNEIDIQSALQANQQRLQNLNELAAGGMDVSKFGEGQRQFNTGMNQDLNKLGEQSREFNVGGLMDQQRLDRDTQKWAEDARNRRSTMMESIAQFLEDYDLQRMKMKQGLAIEDPKLIQQRIDAVAPVMNGSVGAYNFNSGSAK